ncbi:DNA-directed RNA polymerase subunit RPC12/RpoP [Paenibacillus sp. SORGH_AS306]|uniref:hypothetical protein n=1 Tax=unclassified Paenibacillus TaxID=185978 RepID=UPI00278305D1|nr:MULTISPECIES: hypothetical protein [unclassified Paenibacillus]MDQ1233335.1 DNA-directed RNA polymerase subunit RPC12/RpoP [Paenibacillus sp. SORGH_AS_0306]MDR6110376.1 DNA-directed RNA polymerase subunit RPC12/RpoP [Paenibacillus sp. SORGH_AS_0338]
MSNIITIKNEDISTCPQCNGNLTYQERWDDLFDRYDHNTPAMDMVITRLQNEREPKYICDDCQVKILVSP